MPWSVVSRTSLWVYYAFPSFLSFTSHLTSPHHLNHSVLIPQYLKSTTTTTTTNTTTTIPQKPTMPSLCAPENLITVSDYPVHQHPPSPRSRAVMINRQYQVIATTHRLAHTLTWLSNSDDPRDRTELLRRACEICEEMLTHVPAIGTPWEEWMEVDREIEMLMRVSVVGYEVLGERVRACR